MLDDITAWQKRILALTLALATGYLAWQLLAGQRGFDAPTTWLTLLVLLACTVALMWYYRPPLRGAALEGQRTRWVWYVLIVVVLVVVLFALRTVVGPPLLFGFPVIALIALVVLRPKLARREIMYAAALALIAGLAGLGAGWVTIPPLVWAPLQVLLVSTGLLAGWAVLRHTGLLDAGTGRSRYLSEGVRSALRGFLLGALIGTPWALGLVALGSADSETWVQHWWQPLTAINPAIAEEAWGRILLIPLLYLLLRRVSRPRLGYLTALIIAAYWFAYLHTSGGVEDLFSTVLIGTLYSLPVSYLCMHRDLETAMGFHFWLDLIKFVAAYLANAGLWIGR